MTTTQKLIQPKIGLLKVSRKIRECFRSLQSYGLFKRQLLSVSEIV